MRQVSGVFGALVAKSRIIDKIKSDNVEKAVSISSTEKINLAVKSGGVGTVFDSGSGLPVADSVEMPDEVKDNSVITYEEKLHGRVEDSDEEDKNDFDPTVGYTLVSGSEYKKDGESYYLNNKTKKMETKEERINSALGMIESYLSDLKTNLPNNSYVDKLLNLVKQQKNQISSDINITDLGRIPGFENVAGFGGFGKITLDDGAFNKADIAGTAKTIIHELVHYADADNITSKAEELDAYALESGFAEANKLYAPDPDAKVKKINESYSIDLREGENHDLNDSTMDEFRNFLGYTESVQAGLKKDDALSSFTGSFINTAGTVFGAGIKTGGAIGGIFGKTGKTVGKWIGGTIAFVPAVVAGITSAVTNTVGFVVKKAASKVSTVIADTAATVTNAVSTAAKKVGKFFKKWF